MKPVKQETIISLLRKIRALADRGAPGECDVARAKLSSLLERHNLTLDDLGDETVSTCRFQYRTREEKQLLFDLYFYVMNARTVRYATGLVAGRRERAIYFDLTKAQEGELRAFVSTYLPAWRAEYKKTTKAAAIAFVQVHRLFHPAGNGDGTEMPREELLRILALMRNVTPVSGPRLQIQDSGLTAP